MSSIDTIGKNKTKGNKSSSKNNIVIVDDDQEKTKQNFEIKDNKEKDKVQENKVQENLTNSVSYELSDIITIKEFKTKELMHYKKLDNFFSSCTKEENQLMVDIINGTHLISLRFLDWFVTRYCFLYKLAINVSNPYVKQENFNINISYKAQLKSFKKKYFDPFRRKKKFYYVCEKNNLVLLTTLGQLNFFRWAISYDIIKYTETNYRDIITKITHVNTYFKKNIIENSSYSTSDSADITKSNTQSETTESETVSTESLGSTNNLNQLNSNPNIRIESENKSTENKSSESKSIENKKDWKKLKDSKAKYKNPVVSRNIFLEL